jgi:hypothetical protein
MVTGLLTSQEKQWSLLVARAWADEDFKRRLIENPQDVLREHGMELAPGVQVRVLEDSDSVRHFTIPPSPSGDLTEEELGPSPGMDSFSGVCGRCGRCGCGCGGCRCGGCAAS